MTKEELQFPEDRHYTRSDEWVQSDGATCRVGITDYAQCELSDVVFVELPELGSALDAEEAFGVVESVKAVSDLFAPLAGEVTAINQDLEEHPEWINEDPYGRGWIVAIAPGDPRELDNLMSAADYRKYVEERSDS